MVEGEAAEDSTEGKPGGADWGLGMNIKAVEEDEVELLLDVAPPAGAAVDRRVGIGVVVMPPFSDSLAAVDGMSKAE